MHGASCVVAEGFGKSNLRRNDVAVAVQLAKLDKVGKHRVQPIRVDELLRKIKR
jgi:hypothetical protein